MTEKEKARSGLLYDANYDPQLLEERIRAKDICQRYNALPPTAHRQALDLLGQLVARMGKDCHIEPPFFCDYGSNIEMGDNFYANHNCVILDGAPVRFGSFVFVGPNCGFYTAGHPLDVSQRNRGLEYAYPITVEDNVWIGGHVVILPGVKIGKGSVIGAGSVVTRDIPPNVVAVGNPCRVVREIGPEDATRYPA